MGDVRDGFTGMRIELGAGPIHYREIGQGPPVVFVHGYPVNGRIWEETAQALAPTHRCIVPDWPLGGHSEAMNPEADLSPHGVARLISEFLAALELEDVTIVGNDAGGAVSQMLVTELPARIGRLVLTNCDCFKKFPPGRFKPLVTLARSRATYRVVIKSMQLRPIRRSPLAFGSLSVNPVDDALIRSFTEPSERDAAVREDGRKFLAAGDVRDTLGAAAKLPGLEMPALLAWGTDDIFFTLDDAHRLAELIPDCRIVEIPGAACFAQLDKPREVAAAIESFVTETVVAAS